MTRVLQTRQVGLTTHKSGHVMAPPDLVYEVEEEAPRRQRTTWLQRIVTLGSLAGVIAIFANAIAHFLFGIRFF